MMDRRDNLVDVFKDTQLFYQSNNLLKEAVDNSVKNSLFYLEDDYPDLPDAGHCKGTVRVSKSKTFEAAVNIHNANPNKRIAVLNFASATNPGGGVRTGSSAQEESLCRCSTLYPSLDQQKMWDRYYSVNRASSNPLHTDAIIYTPGVVICKSDESIPKRLKEEQFVFVDVITCAAPNLRRRVSNSHNTEFGNSVEITDEELFKIHVRRARHILHVAAVNSVDILVLGAFGCGAFQNNPNVVARAYREALKDYANHFDLVDFAIYCRDWETDNYDAFKRYLG